MHPDHAGPGPRDDALRGASAVVVVVSDRCAAGLAEDRSGPAAVALLRRVGLSVREPVIVQDGADQVREVLAAVLASGPRLVVTSGGTGIGPRDKTPEGTRPLLVTELPGLSEAIRRAGEDHVATAVLSRGLAGVTEGRQVVVNLPGSPAAVEQGLAVLVPLLAHLFDQLDGGDHS